MPEDEILSIFQKRDNNAIIENVKIKKKKTAGFFCMSLSLWKYETVFKAMQETGQIKPILFIAPKNDNWSIRKKLIREMISYCKINNFEYVPLKNSFLNIGQDISKYDLDFVFFTQPYYGVLCNEYSYEKFNNSLLCFAPYGYGESASAFSYTSILHKIAWKVFYPSTSHRLAASAYGQRTDNIVVTGPLGFDMFKMSKPYPWKNNKKMKIIWAPHHSVNPNGWLHISCFMDVYDYMLEIAGKYQDFIDIAFKPHPYLFTKLCNIWGEQRAKEYYHKWTMLENGFLYEGDPYALFKSSDALIHDCGSFTVEYLYANKPCQYLLLNGHHDLQFIEPGEAAFNAHYHANKKQDIEDFILNVVINGNDTYADNRKQVFEKYILSPSGKNATENILEELLKDE